MVNISVARDIAIKIHGGYDYVTEYENAFVFSEYDDDNEGGNGPCAVMKASARPMPFVLVLEDGLLGEEIKHGYIKDVIA